MKKLLMLALLCQTTATANAHFIWLAPVESGGQTKVCVYFGEDATDDSSEYLSRVNGVKVSRITGVDEAVALELTKSDEAISTTINIKDQSVYVASHDLGVMDRGDSKFRLMYYAKTGPGASSAVWQKAIATDDLKLDVVPTLKGSAITLKVCFAEKPVAGVQIKAARPGADDIETETDENGMATFAVAEAGLYSIRARHVEAKAGELNGKAYSETRHYSTVALFVPTPASPIATTQLQDLPEPVTSFGAAVLNDVLYLYGGHTGSAHSYSKTEQGHQLMKLSLKSGEWEGLAEGPGLQGLALVAHGKKLYRVGGFTAMNEEGEDHVLVSQNYAARFDPATNSWTDLPALPEPRSSHDAAVVGDTIYVVGGWAMNGKGDSDWHDTAWKMDMTVEKPSWEAITAPPFQRRAIAAAAHNGKLYVIGGMQSEGGPTTKTSVYDPASNKWSEGPALVVKADMEPKDDEKPTRSMSSGGMTGFGASAFATGGSLYVTTVQGTLQKLSNDGAEWAVISENVTPRFFHRLLPVNAGQLVVVGGSNMSSGKFEKVEVIDVGAET